MGIENFLGDLITEDDSYSYALTEVLKFRAEKTPGETAFIFLKDGELDEDKMTYGEFYRDAAVISNEMIRQNLKGQRAILLFPPGLEFIRALFACFYAGIIAVPAYPPRRNRSSERIRKLVVDSGATVVLTISEIQNSFEKSLSDIIELKNLHWLATDKIPQSPNPPILKSPNPADIALLQYTSGSTGNPKGVIITHRNIMRNCEFIRQSFGFSRKTVAVSWLPTFHDMGLVGQIFQPVYTGFPSIIMAPVSFFQKPIRWLKAFTRYRGTMGGSPNFGFDYLVENTTEEERVGLDLSSLKTLYCGAEPIRRSTLDDFVEAYTKYGFIPEMLYPCYGMAETTLIATGPMSSRKPVYLAVSASALLQNRVVLVPDNSPDKKYLVSVGYPWIDTQVRIVNPNTLTSCLPDEVGEVWISGSIVSPGYWNKEKETEETFFTEISGEPDQTYLRSGDLGFIHDGELYISGRLKDLIIFHGRNIYPQDIEFIVEKSHPAIRSNASAAFSIEVNNEEKLVIVAEVERSAIIGINVDEICDKIREDVAIETELAVYAIQLLRTASILKTSSGKIQRKACKEAFLQKKLDVVGESLLGIEFHENEAEAPGIDLIGLEAWLMTWIHEKLKIPLNRIDNERPITAYGLNSMKAVKLQQDFLENYGANFPPYLFFEKISLKQLCEKALKLIEEK